MTSSVLSRCLIAILSITSLMACGPAISQITIDTNMSTKKPKGTWVLDRDYAIRNRPNGIMLVDSRTGCPNSLELDAPEESDELAGNRLALHLNAKASPAFDAGLCVYSWRIKREFPPDMRNIRVLQ